LGDVGSHVLARRLGIGLPVLVVAVVEAAMCAACTSIRATDGRVFSSGDEAVRASAAHDLGCGPDIVEVNNVGVARDVSLQQGLRRPFR